MLVGAAVVAVLVATGCSGSDDSDDAKAEASFVLPPTTTVLDETSLAALAAVADDGTLTFTERTDASELWVLDMTLTGDLQLADSSGATMRGTSGLGPFRTLADTTVFGEPILGVHRAPDTSAGAVNADVTSSDLTDQIEVAATNATVRTQGGR